jgi:hypothetical protein
VTATITRDQAAATRRDALDLTGLHAHALDLNDKVTEFLIRTGDRVHGRTLESDRRQLTQVAGVTVTRQAIRNELHYRAAADYQLALVERDNTAHLVSRRAATCRLADLIREHRMDGEDVADMGCDEAAEMTLEDRSAYSEVYLFLLVVCGRFNESGDDLLQSATEYLGW